MKKVFNKGIMGIVAWFFLTIIFVSMRMDLLSANKNITFANYGFYVSQAIGAIAVLMVMISTTYAYFTDKELN